MEGLKQLGAVVLIFGFVALVTFIGWQIVSIAFGDFHALMTP